MEGMNRPSRLEKLAGCLAGLALGDALGNPTEFLTPQQIADRYGRVERLLSPGPGHPRAGSPAGRITDDTGQALAILETYLEEPAFSPESVARHLLAWAERQGVELERIIGPSTRSALAKLRQGVNPVEAGAAGRTNGAAMRAAVVGLFHPGQFEETLRDAEIASLPTHGTNLAIAGAAAVACAVAAAMTDGATLEEVIQAGIAGAERGERLGRCVWGTSLSQRIELAARLAAQSADEQEGLRSLYDYVGTDLIVAESVAAAFGIVRLADGNPQRAVVLAANLGGDTDTMGAISGAICGAMAGISALEPEMVGEVERVNGLDFMWMAWQIER